MEKEKLQKIEAELRQLFIRENQSEADTPPVERRARSGRVIRRRKGAPDLQIA